MITICHHSIHKVGGIGAAIMLLPALFNPSHAASGTWTGTTDNTWQTSSNWSASPFPGATSGFSSTDIATFAVAGGGIIDLGGTLNVQSIRIGANGGSAGVLTIGDAGDTLNLTSGGNITVGAGVAANETIGTAGGGSVNLSSTNNSTYSFQNFGSGTLTIAGAVTANQSAGNASVLTLGGNGNGTISGALTNAGSAGSGGLALVKNGSGTWTLSGANTYTGTTTVSGGQLVLDYASSTPIGSSVPLSINGGGVTIKGQSSGTTASSLSSVTLGGSTAAINSLTLDSNGGSGVNLTIGTLNGFTSSLSGNLIDLSSSSGNSISVGALGTQISVANGVLMGGIGTSSTARATLVVRDSTGYGFATLSGATSGTIGRLTAGTTLSASNTSATANYQLTDAGTLTRTATLNYSTVTIDSSAGDVTLDMGAFNLASTANGRGILVTGSNDVSITGSGNLGTGPIIHNYGSGTLSLSLASGTFNTTFLGTGFTDYSGTITSTAGNGGFEIGGGIVRLSKTQTMPTTTPFYVSGGGVLEIGADLNGAGAGDFSITVGATGSNLRFFGDSGISAAGSDRVVNFGGAGATLTWGGTGFLTNVDGTTDGSYTLKLSSAKSDAKLTIENGIALGTNTSRAIAVANGSAATDAALSGVLSGTGATLIKQGAGRLELSAANTYSGATIVSAGTLALGSSGSLASTTYSIANGATFDVSAKSDYSLASVAVSIDVGSAGAGFFNGPAGALTLGNTLTLNFSTSTLTDGQTYNLFDFGSQTGDFSSVALSGSITGSLLLTGTDTWTGSFGGYDFTFSESTGTLALSLAAIPEPSTWALLFGGASLLIAVCSKRQGRSRLLAK
ncbi:MAG: putative outer rane autotransporter [Rariglobus sp.]|jgi:autotransporter-associated beta strand protein|nr:putative outer rane autotransporter [Rariglobus sp.]